MPWHCHVIAMAMPCIAMAMPWQCHGLDQEPANLRKKTIRPASTPTSQPANQPTNRMPLHHYPPTCVAGNGVWEEVRYRSTLRCIFC